METSRLLWYLQHRIEYIRNKQTALKDDLEHYDPNTFDYDKLKDFLENKGRLLELQHMVKRIQEMFE
jgi:hypothetical protein